MKISKSSITRWILFLVWILTAYQASLTTGQDGNITVESAIVMFAVITLSAVRNLLSVEIKNKTTWILAAIMGGIAILGAFNEYIIDLFNWSEFAEQKVRLGITALATALTTMAKEWYPTQEAKIIEQQKAILTKTK